jgi:hypothetical protein
MGQGESSGQSRQKCREIMTKNVRTAAREASLREVGVMMRDGDMGAWSALLPTVTSLLERFRRVKTPIHRFRT